MVTEQYQCPDCLWTGGLDQMIIEGGYLICPNCVTVFDYKTWEVWHD